MFNPATFDNSIPDGFSVLEIVPPDDKGQEKPRRFVPLRRTQLEGDISGPLATLRLTQVFGFDKEQCRDSVEAVYRFPLPGDAAVRGVTVSFGKVEIEAELKERTKAETDYKKAKEEGRQAALLTRESPDVFTLQVSGIGPDQPVTVTTSYVQLCRAAGAGWTLRIPLTTSPRYVRSDESNSRHAQGQPLALLRDPGHCFALDLTMPLEAGVQCATHELEITETDGRRHVRLKEGEVVPDRDCVLSWQPVQEEEKPAFQVTVHADPNSDQVYFLGLLAPPRRVGKKTPAREVILLVDHSGSMEGAKWEAADWAVKQFLAGLSDKDSFALGLFHTETTWLAKKMKAGDEKSIQKAIDFLASHRDSGGTELGVALEQALDLPRTNGELSRHVLLITDAEVSDAGRILRLADNEAKQKARRRLDVLCIDAAPNSFLAHELAERGGGVARFLTSAPDQEDITTALDETLADWSQPVATGLRLVVEGDGVEAAGHGVVKEKSGLAIDLGDLPAGRSRWIVGRLPRPKAKEIAFRVVTGDQREVGSCRVSLNKENQESVGVKAVFGARRILGLEYLIQSGYQADELKDQLIRLGYDPEQVLADQPKKSAKVYAENTRQDAMEQLRRLLVSESLTYGLACAETAFVATRKENGKLVKGTVVVANALPAGWSEEFLGGMVGMASVSHSLPRMRSMRFLSPAPMAAETLLCAMSPADTDQDSLMDDVAELAQSFEDSNSLKKFKTITHGRGESVASRTDLAVFSGVPVFVHGEAVLFDTADHAQEDQLPEATTFRKLQLEFLLGAPKAKAVDGGLVLLIFVDDLAQPRARVRLADLSRQGGNRPLNLRREKGQRVRVVLKDTNQTWAQQAQGIEVKLFWD